MSFNEPEFKSYFNYWEPVPQAFWGRNRIANWVLYSGFGSEYAERFYSAKIDYDLLLSLDYAGLDRLGVRSKLHKLKFLAIIERLRGFPATKPKTARKNSAPMWTKENVMDWLDTLPFGWRFIQRFNDLGIDGKRLVRFNEKSIEMLIGVKRRALLKRYILAINSLSKTGNWLHLPNLEYDTETGITGDSLGFFSPSFVMTTNFKAVGKAEDSLEFNEAFFPFNSQQINLAMFSFRGEPSRKKRRNTMEVKDVVLWLMKEGYGREVIAKFEASHIDGAELFDLGDKALRTRLEIEDPRLRVKLLCDIKYLKKRKRKLFDIMNLINLYHRKYSRLLAIEKEAATNEVRARLETIRKDFSGLLSLLDPSGGASGQAEDAADEDDLNAEKIDGEEEAEGELCDQQRDQGKTAKRSTGLDAFRSPRLSPLRSDGGEASHSHAGTWSADKVKRWAEQNEVTRLYPECFENLNGRALLSIDKESLTRQHKLSASEAEEVLCALEEIRLLEFGRSGATLKDDGQSWRGASKSGVSPVRFRSYPGPAGSTGEPPGNKPNYVRPRFGHGAVDSPANCGKARSYFFYPSLESKLTADSLGNGSDAGASRQPCLAVEGADLASVESLSVGETLDGKVHLQKAAFSSGFENSNSQAACEDVAAGQKPARLPPPPPKESRPPFDVDLWTKNHVASYLKNISALKPFESNLRSLTGRQLLDIDLEAFENLGIRNEQVFKVLESVAKNLSFRDMKRASVETWTPSNVQTWLEIDTTLPKYGRMFREKHINGKILIQLTHEMLLGDLGITKKDREDILQNIHRLIVQNHENLISQAQKKKKSERLLHNNTPISQWMQGQVQSWISSFPFGHLYLDDFKKLSVRGKDLLSASNETLRETFHVPIALHREELMDSLNSYRMNAKNSDSEKSGFKGESSFMSIFSSDMYNGPFYDYTSPYAFDDMYASERFSKSIDDLSYKRPGRSGELGKEQKRRASSIKDAAGQSEKILCLPEENGGEKTRQEEKSQNTKMMIVCHFCNKRFDNTDILISHLAVHEKKCSVCSEAFASSEILNEHMALNHSKKRKTAQMDFPRAAKVESPFRLKGDSGYKTAPYSNGEKNLIESLFNSAEREEEIIVQEDGLPEDRGSDSDRET